MNISRGLFGMALTMTPNRQTGYWWDGDEERWYLGNSDEAWAYYRVYDGDTQEYWCKAIVSSVFGEWQEVNTLGNHPWSLEL